MQLSIALEALAGTRIGTGTVGEKPAANAGAGHPREESSQPQNRREVHGRPEPAQAKKAFDAYLRTADRADVQARRTLNIAEAEACGPSTLAKIATSNLLTIETYERNGCLTDRNVTASELMAGFASGRYSESDQLGPIDGYRIDDSGLAQATHAVVKELDVRLVITQALWDHLAASHIPGFPRGALIGDSFTVTECVLAHANEQRTMAQLAVLRREEVADMLRKSSDPKAQALADKVPIIGIQLSDPRGVRDSWRRSAASRLMGDSRP